MVWLIVVVSLGVGRKAVALPVPAPDLAKCGPSKTLSREGRHLNCCLPYSDKIVDFVPPPYPPRTRPAAHAASQSYMEQYMKAVTLMNHLPLSDPWQHMQQANVHCAYCDGAYNQTGYNVQLQIHSSWLFFPFHRAYLYFYERILGKLIGDDSFAIPYWNWDNPAGMTIPSMYADPNCKLYGPQRDASCILYDSKRDARHQPPTVIDLNFNGTEPSLYRNVMGSNCYTMYKQMITNARSPTSFMGRNYSAGSQPNPGPGSVEMKPHNLIHLWTGDPTQTNYENMGVFYSAGRDPIFYAHHANVDRMWELWKDISSSKTKEFKSSDWLDTAFLFWDENKQVVRIKVRDVLDTNKLGYSYQPMPTPWTKCKPKPAVGLVRPPPSDGVTFPLRLKSPVSVQVSRPRVLRSAREKEDEEEVLVIYNIQVSRAAAVKFNVYINAGADDTSVTEESTQFAGSFVNVPMGMDESDLDTASKREDTITTSLSLNLSDILDDLKANADKIIMVTIKPEIMSPRSAVIVGGIGIEYNPT